MDTKKSFGDKYIAPLLASIFFGSIALGVALSLKLHLIFGFLIATALGTGSFILLLITLYYLISRVIGMKHNEAISCNVLGEKEDLRDLLFVSILYGWPLIILTCLAVTGDIGFTIIILYIIPAYISMIDMKIWHYQDPSGKEIVQNYLYGEIPTSSRAGRMMMALIPLMNLVMAVGTVMEWFTSKNNSAE